MDKLSRYTEYKDSGESWIGETPAHWVIGKLKYFAIINPPKSMNFLLLDTDYLVTFLPMEMVKENGTYDRHLKRPIKELRDGFTYFEEQDVIVAKITPCFENGKGALLENLEGSIGFGSTEFHVLRAIPNISDPQYLYFLTQSHLFRATGEAFMYGSAGQKRVPKKHLTDFPFSCPPIHEQRNIADFLSHKTAEIDEAIAKKQRLIELLEERKIILINQAVTKGLNPDVPMKDSGVEWIGEIPEHWDVIRLSWIFQEKDETGYPELPLLVVSINTGVTLRDMDDENHRQIASDFDTYKRALQGDISFNKMRMWQGAVGVVPVDGLVSPDYVVARPSVEINSNYFEYLFRTEAYKAEFLRNSHGIVMDRNRLYWEDFKAIYVHWPPLNEQNEISKFITELDQQTLAVQNSIKVEIENLTEYKTILISEAVTGKIKI